MKKILSAGNPWLLCLLAVCCIILLFAGCTSQQPIVKAGDTVKVYYSVSLPGEQPFQSNRNETPLEFTLGAGRVVPGFEEAVLGMFPGQTRTVTVPAEKAYGPYRSDQVNTLSIDKVKSAMGQIPEMGLLYTWDGEDGVTRYVRFSNMTADTITVDENHPLAGKDLVFEITLVEIVEKTEQ
jgi:peptidylprolyl isomerase